MSMKTNRLNKTISILVLFSLIGQLLFFPDLARAQSEVQATNPILHSSEILFDAAPLAMEHGLALGQLLEEIEQTSSEDLTEETLITAQAHALETAKQAALTEGALTAVFDAITAQNYQSHDALDMDATVDVISTDVYTTETTDLLLASGLTISQVQQLEDSGQQGFQTRRDIGQNGFSSETEIVLTDAGFSAAEVNELEENVAGYGLADASLSTRLAQLQATATEMKLIRIQALTIYTQLLTRRSLLREFGDVPARAITDDDLTALAEDQLRLLVHIGYLDDLWQDGADRNTGEGQWLFVQRYSEQVIDRLDALIVESQNTGLVVDLYVALNIYTTALIAEAGGASLAKTELDGLGDVLAYMAGDDLPEGQATRFAEPTFAWRMISKVSTSAGINAQPLLQVLEPEPSETAVVVASNQSKGRLLRLAPTALLNSNGSVDEVNEDNNSAKAHFYASGNNVLPPEVQTFLLDYLPFIADGLNIIWGVLTGQSDNPWVIGANIVLSFVPILGEVMDIIALVLDPTPWGKAFAAIGLLASIISDGAELLSAIGVVIPPALAAAPAAIVAEGVDVGAAILKRAGNFIGPVWDVIKNIPFGRSIDLGTDILFHMTDEALDLIGGISHWPHSFDEILNLLQSAKNRVIEPFSALVMRYANRLDEFFQIGFKENGFLLGRILSLSDEAASYSDETLDAIVRISDDVLGEAAGELSDEAASGLGKMVDDLGEGDARRFLDSLPCSVAQLPAAKSTYLGKPAQVPECVPEEFLNAYDALTDAGRAGVTKISQIDGVDASEVASIFADYTDELASKIFDVVGESTATWNKTSLDGLRRVADQRNSADAITNLVTSIGNDTRAMETFMVLSKMTAPWGDDAMYGVSLVIKHKGSVDDVLGVIKNTGGDSKTGERLFRLITEGENSHLGSNANSGWSGFVSSLASVGGKEGATKGNLWGNSHSLFFIEDNGGFAAFSKFEHYVSKDGASRFYDLVDINGNYFEMKNIAQWNSTEHYGQMINDLRILEDSELQNLTWVFRGEEGVFDMTKDEIIAGLRQRVADDPALLAKLDDGLFGTDNLLFTNGTRPYP